MERNLLEYKGTLSSEVRLQLIDLLQCIALSNLGQRSDLKRLVGIALELLDNAQRYTTDHEVDFSWRIEGNELVVTITNLAQGQHAHRLLEAVQRIGSMSHEEIVSEFRRQMVEEDFGEKGGAGLGFLQIARKLGNNIEAKIVATSDDAYLCTSKVTATLASAAIQP